MADTGGRDYTFGKRWGAEHEAQLKADWTTGYTASEIKLRLSTKLGFEVSRNAILGKADRMDLPPRARAGGRTVAPHDPARPKEPKAPKLALVPKPAAPECMPKLIWDIGAGECRFVIDRNVFGGLYCAAPTDGVWCAYHHGIVYRRGESTPAPRPWHPSRA